MEASLNKQSTASLFGNAFINLQKTYNNWKYRKQTMRELNALTDRELQDIGLSRGMIAQVAREAEFDNH